MLLENGIWLSNDAVLKGPQRPALFLDRDGVVVKEVNYLSRIEDVALEHGAVDLLRWAAGRDIPVIVITNQAGIARGLFDWAVFEAVRDDICRKLEAEGLAVALTLACPYHPDFTLGFTAEHARWRKPGAAMLELAAEMTGVDLSQSWMVGDRAGDIEAARNAGLAGGVHVETGHGTGERAEALSLARENFRVLVAADPLAALEQLRPFF
jgi:D-glycero-D-manno-heptose 1,7-bisphosphate phosphatase